MTLVAAAFALAASAVVPTAAGLYTLEDSEVRGGLERETTTGAATTSANVAYGSKATPSYSWRLRGAARDTRGATGEAQASRLTIFPEYSYKILDRVVLGLGLGAERAGKVGFGRVAPAFAVKGETLSFGYGADFRFPQKTGLGAPERSWVGHAHYAHDARDAFAAMYRRAPFDAAFGDEHVFDFVMRRRYDTVSIDTTLGYRVAPEPLPNRKAVGVALEWTLVSGTQISVDAAYEFGSESGQSARSTRVALGVSQTTKATP